MAPVLVQNNKSGSKPKKVIKVPSIDATKKNEGRSGSKQMSEISAINQDSVQPSAVDNTPASTASPHKNVTDSKKKQPSEEVLPPPSVKNNSRVDQRIKTNLKQAKAQVRSVIVSQKN